MNRLECGCEFHETILGLTLVPCGEAHREQAGRLISAERLRLSELDLTPHKNIGWPTLGESRAELHHLRAIDFESESVTLHFQSGRRFGKTSEIDWRRNVSRYADVVIHNARSHLRSTVTPLGHSGDGRTHPSPEQVREIQQLWGDANADIYVFAMALITVTMRPPG